MLNLIKSLFVGSKAKRIESAKMLLSSADYRVSKRGDSITLDEAIEVMVHQVTAGRPPEPEIYRLIYESLAMSIHLASVGTSVYETLAIKDNVIEVQEGKIRDMQCTLRSLQLGKEGLDNIIRACRSLQSMPLILKHAIARYDKQI